MPPQEHLFELEQELSILDAQKALYVLYPDETGGNWRIQAVSISPDSFVNRKSLPEPWRGVRDEELSKVTGVPGGIFVHASGFIGGKLVVAALTYFLLLRLISLLTYRKQNEGRCLTDGQARASDVACHASRTHKLMKAAIMLFWL